MCKDAQLEKEEELKKELHKEKEKPSQGFPDPAPEISAGSLQNRIARLSRWVSTLLFC